MVNIKTNPKSESSSDSEESSQPETPAPNVKRESPTVKREAESSSGESESGESESSSEESSSEDESGSGEEENESSKENLKKEQDAPSDQQPTKKVSFIQPQSFKPPSGFKSTKKQSSSSSVSSLLSNLNGKQVFHITAPSFLPLSKVKEISLGNVMQGEPVLKHDGVDYGIPMDSISQGETDGKTLLLHDPKSQTYYSTPASDIQSFHVQELIRLPGDNGTGSISAQDYEKPPKKQPKHLKMRFRPVGSGNGPAETIGTSDEESEEKPTFKVPKDTTEDKEERKRKHRHTEDQANGETRKKSKKHSSSEGGDKMDVDGKEKKKSSKSKDKDEKKRKKAEKAWT